MPDPRTLPTGPFRVVTLLEPVCGGGCPNPFGNAEPPLYETVDAAIADLRDQAWLIVGDLTLCPACAAAADCALTDHQWTDWKADSAEGLSCRSRECRHCSVQEYDPPLADLEVLVRTQQDLEGGAGDVAA